VTDDIETGQPVVDNAMLDALQKDAGLPHLPTQETYQFRMAVSGEGPLAYQWSDKPHRLLYDACRIIEREAALRTYSNAAAAPADRIGGGGGLPCGVVGVATQSDADVLSDKSDDYAIGFLSVLLERELYENGHTIGEDLAERLAEIAVKTVRHPPQSDALRVTDEMVERLAVYIAKEEARNCKTLGAAVEHRSNWRRIIPEAREMLTAALRQPTQSDALRDALADLLHAVCGKTGFAETVRRDSGRIYPWPALDLAEAKAIAALEQSK